MPEILPVASDTKTTINVQELIKNSECYNAFVDQTQKMNWIQDEMRETPAPKSDELRGQPRNNLQRVEFPPEGGVLTYMEGFDQPFQGFPLSALVERMDLVKKMTKGFKSGFYHILWKHFKGLKKYPMLFLTYPFFKLYTHAEIYACWRHIERHKIKPKCYCRAVREVFRAFSLPVNEDEKYKSGKLREQIRDLFCMHLEFDNAYRFRFQDVIVSLNKDSLKKNPLKEIMRLFDIMSSREINQEVKDTWTLTKTMFEYLRFSKEIKPIVISFLENLDLDKCKLAKEDFPYCKSREDYNFGTKLKI